MSLDILISKKQQFSKLQKIDQSYPERSKLLILKHSSTHTPPPSLYKGWGQIFLKMAIMGEWEIFTGNGGGSQEWGQRGDGGLFYNGKDGRVLKFLCIVGRGVLTPLF